MNLGEKIEYLKLMGFDDELANYYAKLDEGNTQFAVVAGLRFLRTINSRLQQTKTEYADFIKNNPANITDAEKKLLDLGATPELIAEFKYNIEKNNTYQFLYNISDYSSCDFDETTSSEYIKLCQKAPYCNFVEMIDGQLTGRYIAELHELFPFDE